MRIAYLTGESIYLRAMVEGDKECAVAWFASPFPINAARAEEFLKEAHKDLETHVHYLVIARLADDEVVGGVAIQRWYRHSAELTFHMAPTLEDADALRAEAVRVMVPWLRDERESLTIDMNIPADQPETIAALEAMGLRPVIRLREHIARGGYRVDLLTYQWYHPRLESEDAADA